MKNKFLKMCSVILVMGLLFNMLPHRALADMLSGEESSLPPESSAAGGLQDISATEEIPATEKVTFQQFDASDAEVVGEVTEKWTAYSKEFRLRNGLEDYWDYTSSSAGRAGTGYVNNYTGNLVWVREDMGFGGNLMPVSISHIYNLNDAVTYGNVFGLGVGWRTNYHQRVFQWQADTSCYIWEDSDGTDHYFTYKSAGVYKDEDGLELTLTTTGTGNPKYCISDKMGNCSYFDTYGRLTKQSNNQATKSHITITYEGTSYRISRITDGAGRKYDFSYTNNLLSQIVYTGSGENLIHTVSYSCENNNLTAITDADNKTCRYYYSNNGVLESVENIDDYKLFYDYNTPTEAYQPYRVQRVTEMDCSELQDNWIEGNFKDFVYEQNQTTITDSVNNVQVIQFNNWGDMTGIYDDEGRGQFFRYTTDSDPNGTPHQLRTESDLQTTTVNHLENPNFYSTDIEDIWFDEEGGPGFEVNLMRGYRSDTSLHVWSSQSNSGINGPEFTLREGESITFSGYVKNEEIDVYFAISDVTDGGIGGYVESERLTSRPYQENDPEDNWRRIEVSYTNDTNAEIIVRPRMIAAGIGGFHVDCVQLEYAVGASSYNWVENGDFRFSNVKWSVPGACVGYENMYAPQLSDDVLTFSGNYNGARYSQQAITVSGTKADTFVLSGWGCGNATLSTTFAGSAYVPNGDRVFGLFARFVYSNGNYSAYQGVAFNPGVENWQYAATQIVAPESYVGIEVILAYDHDANDVYFDGIALYKGKFGTTYTYYPNNDKLASVTAPDGNKTQYTYYANGDLHTVLEPSGVYTTYTYDIYHNITQKKVEDDVEERVCTIHKYAYDAYGNKTSAESSSETVGSTKSTYKYTGDLTVPCLFPQGKALRRALRHSCSLSSKVYFYHLEILLSVV